MNEFLMLLWLGDIVDGLGLLAFIACIVGFIGCYLAHLLYEEGEISKSTRLKSVKTFGIIALVLVTIAAIAPSKQTVHTSLLLHLQQERLWKLRQVRS
jgi:DMSO/TMAO reductase YedYZ heme-binding membrane subunit